MAADSFERVYAALLRLYPAGFRAEYGEPMRLHFRDQLRDARRVGGGAVVAFALRALWDVWRTSAVERGAIHPPVGSDQPVAWRRVAAALLPGVLTLLWWLSPASGPTTSIWPLFVFYGLLAAYIAAGWLIEGRVALWGLPVAGLLTMFMLFDGLTLIFLPVRKSLIGRSMAELVLLPFVLGMLFGVIAVFRALRTVAGHSPRRAALAAGLMVLSLVPFIWGGLTTSNRYALWGQFMLGTGLMMAPLGGGVWLARRYGDRAVLFVIGAVQYLALIAFDPGGGAVWAEPWRSLYPLALELVTLVVVPLLALRLRHPLVRAAGVLLPVGAVFGLGLVLVAAQEWATGFPAYDAAWAASTLGWLTVALALYGGVQRERTDRSARHASDPVIIGGDA